MSRVVDKVCPIVLRSRGGALEVLAFRHPLAGFQLVKGTREAGESISSGALRELREESGVLAQDPVLLCSSDSIAEGQAWHFVRVSVADLPDHWSFDCADDGGHWFAFFWWDLAQGRGDEWHPPFVRALETVASCSAVIALSRK